MIDYTLVVPSRKRSHNMETIRWLLPTAMICIDEREVEDYAPHVAASQLLVHPAFDGLPRAFNWLQQTVTTECLVMVDDDFAGVRVNVGSKRFITDSEEILGIIENAMRCCSDLKLTSFCWSRTQNTTVIHPEIRPIVPVQSVSSAFGCMGRARTRLYDPALLARASIDWTMHTLLEDRAVYTDLRFYFDFGRIFSGRGGNVGLVTPESFKDSTRELAKRWGKNVSFKPPGYVKNREVASMRIAVSRTNKTAQK